MHYKLHCDVTKGAIRNFTEIILQAYEENKDKIINSKIKQKNKGPILSPYHFSYYKIT